MGAPSAAGLPTDLTGGLGRGIVTREKPSPTGIPWRGEPDDRAPQSGMHQVRRPARSRSPHESLPVRGDPLPPLRPGRPARQLRPDGTGERPPDAVALSP